MMMNEIKSEEEKISLWSQIKEDFSVPKLNDPAFNSNFEIFFNYPVFFLHFNTVILPQRVTSVYGTILLSFI